MAMPLYTVTTGGTPFSAATGAKTVLNLIAGANQAILLKSVTLSTNGTTSSAVPAQVDVCQSTQAGAGTSAGSPPAVVQASGRTLASQITTGWNYTAEPTVLTPLDSFYFAQFMGLMKEALPLGDEYETDFSGGTIKALAIRINTSATVNVIATARFWLVG